MPRIITLTPNPALDYAVEAETVLPNRKLRCTRPQTHPGGGGVNVARAAMRLGADVLAIFTTGGAYGDALTQAIAAERVPIRKVSVAGETRLAFHAYDQSAGNEYRFNLPGAEMSTDEADRMLKALAEEISDGDFIVGSGSLPPGAPSGFWAKAARIAKTHNAKFVLDSTSGVDEALRENIFLLRKNKHEVAAMAGRALTWPDETAAFAQSLIAKGGAEKMAVTHGSDGAIMASKDNIVRAPGADIKVVSAVGAGDSFMAALVCALMKGEPDSNALRYAMAAAGATLMSSGTSLFDPEDVEGLYSAVRS